MLALALLTLLPPPQDAGALEGPFVAPPAQESQHEAEPERQDSAVPS